MPSDRTMVTELGTALGMLGTPDVDAALAARPAVMHSLSPEMWDRLAALRRGGVFDADFHAAFENGRAFLWADDGLRGRIPRIIEWKGTGRAPGDEVAPIDLRVDHVYLVSCKYLSNILFNVSPAHAFDDLLVGGQSRARGAGRSEAANGAGEKSLGGGDWYAEVAPLEYQALYDEVRRALEHEFHADLGVLAHAVAAGERPWSGRARGSAPALPGFDPDEESRAEGAGRPGRPGAPSPLLASLPERATDLSTDSRDALADWLKGGWPGAAKAAYQRLAERASAVSVQRWQQAMDARGGNGESLLWRLLRMGSAPYFVLGSSARRSLRLRIATPWDWRTHFALGGIRLAEQVGGQPRVGWQAVVRDRVTGETHELSGHIEVRWSHGRFGGLPEAKGYLDTAHHLVPGYFSLQ
jgi:hypothetical protein